MHNEIKEHADYVKSDLTQLPPSVYTVTAKNQKPVLCLPFVCLFREVLLQELHHLEASQYDQSEFLFYFLNSDL